MSGNSGKGARTFEDNSFSDFGEIPLWPWEYHHYVPPGEGPSHCDLFYCNPHRRCASCLRRYDNQHQVHLEYCECASGGQGQGQGGDLYDCHQEESQTQLEASSSIPTPSSLRSRSHSHSQSQSQSHSHSCSRSSGSKSKSLLSRRSRNALLSYSRRKAVTSGSSLYQHHSAHALQRNRKRTRTRTTPPSDCPFCQLQQQSAVILSQIPPFYEMGPCKVFPYSSCYICSSTTDEILGYSRCCHLTETQQVTTAQEQLQEQELGQVEDEEIAIEELTSVDQYSNHYLYKRSHDFQTSGPVTSETDSDYSLPGSYFKNQYENPVPAPPPTFQFNHQTNLNNNNDENENENENDVDAGALEKVHDPHESEIENNEEQELSKSLDLQQNYCDYFSTPREYQIQMGVENQAEQMSQLSSPNYEPPQQEMESLIGIRTVMEEFSPFSSPRETTRKSQISNICAQHEKDAVELENLQEAQTLEKNHDFPVTAEQRESNFENESPISHPSKIKRLNSVGIPSGTRSDSLLKNNSNTQSKSKSRQRKKKKNNNNQFWTQFYTPTEIIHESSTSDSKDPVSKIGEETSALSPRPAVNLTTQEVEQKSKTVESEQENERSPTNQVQNHQEDEIIHVESKLLRQSEFDMILSAAQEKPKIAPPPAKKRGKNMKRKARAAQLQLEQQQALQDKLKTVAMTKKLTVATIEEIETPVEKPQILMNAEPHLIQEEDEVKGQNGGLEHSQKPESECTEQSDRNSGCDQLERCEKEEEKYHKILKMVQSESIVEKIRHLVDTIKVFGTDNNNSSNNAGNGNPGSSTANSGKQLVHVEIIFPFENSDALIPAKGKFSNVFATDKFRPLHFPADPSTEKSTVDSETPFASPIPGLKRALEACKNNCKSKTAGKSGKDNPVSPSTSGDENDGDENESGGSSTALLSESTSTFISVTSNSSSTISVREKLDEDTEIYLALIPVIIEDSVESTERRVKRRKGVAVDRKDAAVQITKNQLDENLEI